MNKNNDLNLRTKEVNFSKNRRFKSFLFLATCTLIATFPHLFNKKPSIYILFAISFLILFYGIWVLSKNRKVELFDKNVNQSNFEQDIPTLDILVAARDEQNVISRLVERLFNLDYPSEKLNIFIIDDGSEDNTPQMLKKLSEKFQKLKIIRRNKNAGGGKSGALNHALKFIHGDWVLILDADAQLKKDTLLRMLHYAVHGSWKAVQLRKSVVNLNNNFLTNCQAIEMAMDAFFQYGRLYAAGNSELRGNGQLIKKETLLNCGSFNEETVTDDLDLSVRLLLSDAQIGILWDPPVMEEAVESLSALFAQRQRWAEGGLQRFFDYDGSLIFGKLKAIQKFDLFYFFVLQYALPIISLIDLITAFIHFHSPVYWPISITAFMLSAIAAWFGCKRNHEGPVLPSRDLSKIVIFLIYLSHWFIIIPLVTLKMSILQKKLLWKKTLHKG
tara:strand:- start:5435 stop:6766 length:1332 start_codon:yes stop_codon:yes gene_type:complete